MAFFDSVYNWVYRAVSQEQVTKDDISDIVTYDKEKIAAVLVNHLISFPDVNIKGNDQATFARFANNSGMGVDVWWDFRKPLEFLWKKNIKCTMANDHVYRSSSSCLIKRSIGGYYCLVRSVNYDLDEITGAYNYEGVVRTKNYLMTLNDSLYPLCCEEVKAPPPITNDVYVFGLEDVRIFGSSSNHINIISTTAQYHQDRKLRILSGKLDVHTGKVVDHHVFSLNENGCEKNWTPIPADFYRGLIGDTGDISEYVAIHTIYPHRIINMETEKSYFPDISLEGLNTSHNVARSLRGSSVPVPYKDGYLFIVHNVGTRTIHQNHVRVYYHRMVYIHRKKNETGEYTGNIHMNISDPFTFNNQRVEFCLSICWHEDGLLVNYSEFDKTSVVGCLPETCIEKILWP